MGPRFARAHGDDLRRERRRYVDRKLRRRDNTDTEGMSAGNICILALTFLSSGTNSPHVSPSMALIASVVAFDSQIGVSGF